MLKRTFRDARLSLYPRVWTFAAGDERIQQLKSVILLHRLIQPLRCRHLPRACAKLQQRIEK